MSALETAPKILHRFQDAADLIIERLGKKIRLGAPLGLGKPNALLNLLYQRAKEDPSLQLDIYTALSLAPPNPTSDLARRFFGPFKERFWGPHYQALEFETDGEHDHLPDNVRVHEFYFQAGDALGSETLQRHYQSINYTHVAESLLQADVQIIVQLIARKVGPGGTRYSLASNPDVTLDVADLYKARQKPLSIFGVVHPDLPFAGGEAEVDARFFDVIVEDSSPQAALFALPRLPVNDVDQMIGFYTSQLIPDNGTLQVGIGSLSDSVIAALLMRHEKNDIYRRLCDKTWEGVEKPAGLTLEKEPFKDGLYGLSEMLTDGYMHLRRHGILKRCVVDEDSGTKTFLHGAFFLGSKEFYAWLRSLRGEDFEGLRMTRVSKINDLYDPHELLLRRQRINARFLNTCMQATLLGGAASDTLEDGRVVSGVGGQYNFVSMAQELRGARSILMLRSARQSKGRRRSNIVWSHGQETIPRHLRDIVVTEYGIADLRGKSDEETIHALLCIADSEFQDRLAQTAKKNHKLRKDYAVPPWARDNTPGKVKSFVAQGRQAGVFAAFPFGSDFTPEEEKLTLALTRLQSTHAGIQSAAWMLKSFGKSYRGGARRFDAELKRMKLDHPRGFREKITRRLLLTALQETIVNEKRG